MRKLFNFTYVWVGVAAFFLMTTVVKGETDPIFEVLEASNIKKVKAILSSRPEAVNVKTDDGATPLSYAAVKGDYEISALLIASGAHVNARDDWNQTPLHGASFMGHIEVVKLLISQGADINAESKVKIRPLHLAALKGHKDIVSLLLDNDADINARDHNERTALHKAVQGNAEFIKDKGNQRFLVLGAGHKGREVVELLLLRGADVKSRDNNGDSPLSLAEKGGEKEIAGLLRKHGATK